MIVGRWLGQDTERARVRDAEARLAVPRSALGRLAQPATSPGGAISFVRRVGLGLLLPALLACGATSVSAGPTGKLQFYGHRMEPEGQDAERFSRASWGGGLNALASLRNIYHLLAGEVGLEYTNFLTETTETRLAGGLRVEQQTNQHYFRFYAGPRVGLHGNGFIRPFLATHVAFVQYGISTDVVIPDDRDRENEIRQSLRDENRAAFGYDVAAGVDWNIVNKFPVETGVRFLKSFNVPQQLGDGSVAVQPGYVQYYVGIGLNFPRK